MTRTRGLRPFRRAHLRNARQEILLAVKAVVDETVARSEGRAAKLPARKPKSS